MRPNMLCIFGSYIVYIFEVNMEDILFIIDSDLKQIHLKYSMNSNLSSLYLQSFKLVFTLYEVLSLKYHVTHQIKIYFAINVLVIIHHSILCHLDFIYGHLKFIQYQCVAGKAP